MSTASIETPSGVAEMTLQKFEAAFGAPGRLTKKIVAWTLRAAYGVVLEIDSPRKDQAAHVWVPYPPDGSEVPELALEYPAEQGRHSNTYPAPGLARGEPALKLVLRTEKEVQDAIAYATAAAATMPLPDLAREEVSPPEKQRVDVNKMPPLDQVAPRRKAIPRLVQREVWQRDGGRCVECGTREKLCFDHIVPFSLGGSNTVRNLQLLCEPCNGSKGNRI